MKAFQIKVDGEVLDYRLGKELDLNEIKYFFAKKYQVVKLWSAGRHVVGILRKEQKEFWLKLATTVGIGALTQNEFKWNEQFNLQVKRENSDYWVPKNYESGFYGDLFYLISDKFEGQLLADRPEKSELASKMIFDHLSEIIDFSEAIQRLGFCHSRSNRESRPLSGYWISAFPTKTCEFFRVNAGMTNRSGMTNYREYFLEKTNLWFMDIPDDIKQKYRVMDLLNLVKDSYQTLKERPRHGDFTPWHLMLLKNGKLGLIDGEHALENGVENYDLGYFLQRVYSVLGNPALAKKILELLIKRGYRMEKLKTILAARAIGGFLDESLKPQPNYQMAVSFKEFVKSL